MGKFIPQHRAAIPQFVLFSQQSSEIEGMVRWLAANQYDTSGKFIIICISVDSEKCNEKDIFGTLSRANIGNVLFIKGTTGDEEPTLYSYFPILPEKCVNSEPIKINISLGCSNDTCFKRAFPEKFSNMYGCPFIVSTFEQPPFMHFPNNSTLPVGRDGEILSLLVTVLNASLIIKTPVEGIEWGHYQNNNWTGSLGDVFNDHAHASMCSAPLNPAKYGNFQISFTYNSMDIVWAAGLPTLKPPWEKLLHPLQIYVRIIIFFMFIGIIFMNTFTKTRAWRKVIKALNIVHPKANLLFYSWAIFLGLPILKMPSKPSLLVTVGMWLWFSLMIRTVYQAALVSTLKQRFYEDTFETFADVIANKNPFGGQLSLREYYYEDKFIYDHWSAMDLIDAYSTLEQITRGTSNFVLALNRETILFQLMKSNGSRHLQIIPHKIVNSPSVMFFKRFSLLTAPVNHILSVFLEGGLGQQSYTQFFNKGRTLLRQSKRQRTVPLRLENFVGSFAILFGGWILAAVCFCVELVCGKFINISMHPFVL